MTCQTPAAAEAVAPYHEDLAKACDIKGLFWVDPEVLIIAKKKGIKIGISDMEDALHELRLKLHTEVPPRSETAILPPAPRWFLPVLRWFLPVLRAGFTMPPGSRPKLRAAILAGFDLESLDQVLRDNEMLSPDIEIGSLSKRVDSLIEVATSRAG
jgi:hypothetical protein